MHETGLRLETLTGGEVDSVTGPDGRTLLLQSAQDGLRIREADRRATILNSLPAQVALLDQEGKHRHREYLVAAIGTRMHDQRMRVRARESVTCATARNASGEGSGRCPPRGRGNPRGARPQR